MSHQFKHYKESVVIPDLYKKIINSLVIRRHQLGFSQDELAWRIGCADSLVHKWEQYKRVPSAYLLSCWMEALNCEVEIRPTNAKEIQRDLRSLLERNRLVRDDTDRHHATKARSSLP